MTFVLDASALVKLALDQSGSDKFRAWLADNAAATRLAPYLLWSEAGRALQKELGNDLDGAALAEAHRRLVDQVEFRPIAESLAWRHAKGLTFYDSQYVALAEAASATLVTCDHKMEKAAKKAGVPVVLL